MCSLSQGGARSIKCLVSKTSFSPFLVSNAWSEREGSLGGSSDDS